MRAIFQKKGKEMLKKGKKRQHIWKFRQKHTKLENILKKGRWLCAIIARNKLLEKALHILSYESNLYSSLYDLPVHEYFQDLYPSCSILLPSIYLEVLLDVFHCFPLFHDQNPTPLQSKSYTNVIDEKMDTCDKWIYLVLVFPK